MKTSLDIALKEWAVVCRALESGRQIMLLRKGGIHEVEGVFQLEQKQFLLFPTYLHQNAEMLKSEAQALLEVRSAEPETIHISASAEVTDIIPVTDRAQVDALDAEHIWAKPQIDMRFNYKPQNPLYLILLRTYRLAASKDVVNTATYAGCRSWVPLTEEISIECATPVLNEADYEAHRRAILAKF